MFERLERSQNITARGWECSEDVNKRFRLTKYLPTIEGDDVQKTTSRSIVMRNSDRSHVGNAWPQRDDITSPPLIFNPEA